MAQKRGVPLSGLGHGLPQRFTASDRLQNFAIDTSRALPERLTQAATATANLLAPDSGEVVTTDTTDGLRVSFASGDIVHLRPSGNAPELRCYAEANSVERARTLCQDCLGRVCEA
jgi:phosphomannomutase